MNLLLSKMTVSQQIEVGGTKERELASEQKAAVW